MVPGSDLEARLAEIAGYLNVFHAELVQLTREALTTNGWSGYGIHSLAQWLTIRTGCSPTMAARVVDIAERVERFPCVIEQFSRGLLSLDQTYTVVTRAPDWADSRLAEFAPLATVPQLQRTIRDEYFEDPEVGPAATSHTGADDGSVGDAEDPGSSEAADDPASSEHMTAEPDAAESGSEAGEPGQPAVAGAAPTDDHPFAHDRFSFRWDGNRLVGSFNVSADTGAILEAAINEARDAMFHNGTTDVTWADALREIALRSLDQAPAERRQHTKVMLHVDVSDSTNTARLTNGIPLPATVRDYLTCEADTQPVWVRDNTPVGVGRTQRTIPVRLRTIAEYRDQGCRIPGCTSTHTELHHIVHWRNGGPTETWNLVSVCPKHHRLHHQGVLGIEGNADLPPPEPGAVVFTDSAGQPIKATPCPTAPAGRPAGPAPKYQNPSGERLDLRYFAGWNRAAIERRHGTTWQRLQHHDPPDGMISDAA